MQYTAHAFMTHAVPETKLRASPTSLDCGKKENKCVYYVNKRKTDTKKDI
jgi:hypothetical protein